MTASTARSGDRTATLSPAELLYGDFATEHATTRRFLERYPEGRGDWRPHEKSRTLAQLATHVADIVNRGTMVLETDGMELGSRAPLQPMDSAHALLAHFEGGLARFSIALAAADLDELAQPWALRRDGRVLVEHPRRILLRQMMMSHLTHHRAQLGVYYRLLGVPVPGAYGPSADD
jgi:uncharacterized damage-inducible protein DinB